MLSKSQIEELAYKAKYNKLTKHEEVLLDLWYENHDDTQFKFEKSQKITKTKIWKKIAEATGIHRRFTLWPKLVAAASIALVSLLTLYYFSNQDKSQITFVGNQKDVYPQNNNALLTLENGKQIYLGEKNVQTEISLATTAIVTYQPKKLFYQNTSIKSIAQHTVTTKSGGQYQLVLADGSKIWLNSQSSLTFPTSFAGKKERVVELIGEGYFEIKKNTAKPFIVKSRQQSIKVLGTHFNINSYANEPVVRTTLLEGLISIQNLTSSLILKPGEQAVNLGTSFQKNKIKNKKDTSWKDGYFEFENDDLAAVMRQLERWYGVKIVYRSEIPNKRFSGKIYRNLPLSSALKAITYFDVSFEVKNETIYIN